MMDTPHQFQILLTMKTTCKLSFLHFNTQEERTVADFSIVLCLKFYFDMMCSKSNNENYDAGHMRLASAGSPPHLCIGECQR